MKYCIPIRVYEGNKSEKIKQMINDKIKARLKKDLPKRINNAELKSAVSRYEKAKEQYEHEKKEVEKIEQKLKITYSSYGKKYEVANECFVPSLVISKLQKAQDLYSLGKVKQAKEIWDSLMSEYDLGGEKDGNK